MIVYHYKHKGLDIPYKDCGLLDFHGTFITLEQCKKNAKKASTKVFNIQKHRLNVTLEEEQYANEELAYYSEVCRLHKINPYEK